MYSTVFLDLDGTLTDSKPGIINGVRYALKAVGVPMPAEDRFDSFIGPPLLDSFERECGITGELGQEALRQYRVYYKAQGEFENAVYSGVEDMLKALKAAGKTLITATSKPEDAATRIIEHFELAKYFDCIAGASNDESRNNKPAVIRYALEKNGITDLSGVIMVGDRMHDIEGANIIGLDSIGVLYGYGGRAELEHEGATYIAETPADVVRIILGR